MLYSLDVKSWNSVSGIPTIRKKISDFCTQKNTFPYPYQKCITDFRFPPCFFLLLLFLYFSESRNIKMHDFWSPHNKKVPAFMLEFRLIFVQKEAINIVNVFFSCGFLGVKIFRVSFFYEHEYIRQISHVHQCTFVFLCQLYILDEKIIEMALGIESKGKPFFSNNVNIEAQGTR